MSEERMRILNLLAEGKISAEEAEKLLSASEKTVKAPKAGNTKGKYLYVQVDPKEGKSSEKVMVKVPMALIKAGINVSKLIPSEAQDTIRESMYSKGIDFDFASLDSENIGEFLEALRETSIDVETEETTVKVFCD
ncbi:MAG: DUF2089 domain-containing protein [Spirochaetales bacterium]|nr:DUF2089 domain-containing protein [Spirochaetales bacterium]